MKNLIQLICMAFLAAVINPASAQNIFPDSGFVGIGTTTPELLLDINSPDGHASIGLGTSTIYNGPAGIGFGEGVLTSNLDGDYNTAIGWLVLTDNLIGSYNTAIGAEAMRYNKSGSQNVAVGYLSLKYNYFGESNVAIGNYSLFSNKSGDNNVSIGSNAMLSNKIGNENTAIGSSAMSDNTKGNENTAIGRASLSNNTLGNSNTAIGALALNVNKTGNYNIGIGYNATTTGNDFENSIAVGYIAVVDASNKVLIGNSSVSSIGGEVDWTVYSDARIKEQVEENVPGLDFINQLRPVTYHYNITTQNQLMGRVDTATWTGKYDIEEQAFSGFIAQEVAAAAEDLGYEFSGVDASGRLLGLRYATFVVPLVKAVQELDAENTNLEDRISRLEALLGQQGIQMNESTTDEVQRIFVASNQTQATLSQNRPNPFTGSTSIRYFVPETAEQAIIKIADAAGVSLFMADVKLGNGVLEVDATQLAAGTYSYTLLVDGKVVDTKLMVIQ
ncbi:MAG: tail fiber domain-containing protein [Chitinophagales bacterium]|nr:tail fiber domain-containing protein [Chitinophagales bacterium]HAE13291.1 hypothetical protein [Bacteroidota bacterium]MCB9019645.1 tail fiber domain-containing protein [Chitinophagales bacterium]MCB9021131.1 tail fiber domain-containing protein [Chitinophagales bacterium]HPE96506.1 tail fiber domain-containing protein [Chitinophagales bacterium]